MVDTCLCILIFHKIFIIDFDLIFSLFVLFSAQSLCLKWRHLCTLIDNIWRISMTKSSCNTESFNLIWIIVWSTNISVSFSFPLIISMTLHWLLVQHVNWTSVFKRFFSIFLWTIIALHISSSITLVPASILHCIIHVTSCPTLSFHLIRYHRNLLLSIYTKSRQLCMGISYRLIFIQTLNIIFVITII